MLRRALPLTLAFLSACSGMTLPVSDDAGPPREASVDAAPIVPPDAAPAVDQGPPDAGARPDGGPRCFGPPYPIVLHHGFFGFDRLGPLNYYYAVASDLRGRGENVIEAQVDPFQSSEFRGRQLADVLDRALASTGACKVNVIAHSQGGLDLRYAIGTLGYGDRIASAVTISTPHRGTRVADAVLRILPGWSADLVNFFAHLIGRVISDVNQDANLLASLRTLAQNNVAAFDRANPDDPRVQFFSVAGRSNNNLGTRACAGGVWPNPTRVDPIDPLLSATSAFLNERLFDPVPNDGLVTVDSAKWGTFLGCIPADHFDEIGQIADTGPNLVSGFDHLVFYRDLVAFVRTRGF